MSQLPPDWLFLFCAMKETYERNIWKKHIKETYERNTWKKHMKETLDRNIWNKRNIWKKHIKKCIKETYDRNTETYGKKTHGKQAVPSIFRSVRMFI